MTLNTLPTRSWLCLRQKSALITRFVCEFLSFKLSHYAFHFILLPRLSTSYWGSQTINQIYFTLKFYVATWINFIPLREWMWCHNSGLHYASVSIAYNATFFLLRTAYSKRVSVLPNITYTMGIPEIRCTPPKEGMGIPKILTTFFIGKSPKIKHFCGCKGKEDTGIPRIFNHF